MKCPEFMSWSFYVFLRQTQEVFVFWILLAFQFVSVHLDLLYASKSYWWGLFLVRFSVALWDRQLLDPNVSQLEQPSVDSMKRYRQRHRLVVDLQSALMCLGIFMDFRDSNRPKQNPLLFGDLFSSICTEFTLKTWTRIPPVGTCNLLFHIFQGELSSSKFCCLWVLARRVMLCLSPWPPRSVEAPDVQLWFSINPGLVCDIPIPIRSMYGIFTNI